MCPLGVLCCLCGVLGHLAPVHQRARSVLCFPCAVSSATWLLFRCVPAPCVALCVRCFGPLGSFTGMPARCVVLRVRCPGPPGSRSPGCPLGVLCCLCGVLGHLAPVHQCARSVLCFACAVSSATWLLFRCVPAPCVALRVRCFGPRGSRSPVCWLGVLCCMYGVLGPLASVHRCASSVCVVACVVSWAIWLLTTGLPAQCVVLRVRCPGPLGSCSPVCPLGVLCCVYDVLGPLAFVHRCVRAVCGVACVVSWATWLLFTSVPVRCVVSRVHRPVPLGSCSAVCPLGVLRCVYGVLGHLAPVHQFAHSMCCVECAVSWATWLMFTCVPARCFVLRARCPGPLGSCSPACLLGVLCCMCGVQGPWPLFTGVPARCVVLRVRCPGPLGPCSPVCPLGVLCCVCGVLGHLAPFHRCARSVLCFACVVSWATWLLFRCVPAPCVALRVRCPGPLGSRSPVR